MSRIIRPPMDAEIKQEWIAALRSDEYKQGKGHLTTKEDGTDYDCCLGVLCKIAVKHGVIEPPKVVTREYHTRDIMYGPDEDSNSAILPGIVSQWAGMGNNQAGELNSDIAPKYPNVESSVDCLSAANDGGYTFAEIADIIEEQF